MNVAVGTLRFGNNLDATLNELIEIGIACDSQGRAGRFKPFIEVAIIEGRAAMASSGHAGCALEILKELAIVCALHHTPHRWNRLCAADFEAFGPKALSP